MIFEGFILLTTILASRRKEIDTCLLKLALQTTIYSLWWERKSIQHHGHPQSAGHMVRISDKTIKNMISSLRCQRPSFYRI
ncbi:unnamed protein product [Brassica oleracea]|uniref:Uncharacterized protein n=1 Tax=Brassica oleracea TaxID=3712 RepID=A0A3P6D3R5_BRAOL|nr:unnamed protein product [Brassica oleracea]